MDQHLRHAECVGDKAGVLAAGAAETVQCVARDIVAALNRNFLDRVRHVLDRDTNEAVGDVFRSPDLSHEPAWKTFRARCRHRSAAFCAGPKIFGKNSEMSFPVITLASVTVSGPPRR